MRIPVDYPKVALVLALLGLVLLAGAGCPQILGPTAMFSASPRIGTAPLTVQFKDTSDAGTSAITAWAWDFTGDNVPDSTLQHPAYTFATAADYSVTLTVTTAEGTDTHTEATYIEAVAAPGATWERRATHASWGPRYGHSIVVHQQTDEMWLTGGTDIPTLFGDIWHSSDGATWTQFTPVGTTWSARSFHTSLFFNGEVFVIGGFNKTTIGVRDVWSSSDGVHWTEKQSDAPWGPRFAHSSVVFDGKIWVIGGQESASATNDVWSSPDGITWTEQTAAAAFSARLGHVSVVHNGLMWVIGGEDAASGLSDVWSSPDGITWSPALSGAAWGPRGLGGAAVLDNRIWLMGGTKSGAAPDVYRDLWSSSDGVTWTPAPATPGWTGRTGSPGVVFNFRLWVTGGVNANPVDAVQDDVWCSPSY